jgi:hypothetical protein
MLHLKHFIFGRRNRPKNNLLLDLADLKCRACLSSAITPCWWETFTHLLLQRQFADDRIFNNEDIERGKKDECLVGAYGAQPEEHNQL